MPRMRINLTIDSDIFYDARKIIPKGSMSGFFESKLIEMLNNNRDRCHVHCTKCNVKIPMHAVNNKYDGKCYNCGSVLIEPFETKGGV